MCEYCECKSPITFNKEEYLVGKEIFRAKTVSHILISKKHEWHIFKTDDDCKKWVENRIKSKLKFIRYFLSSSYAILKEDGTYIVGRLCKQTQEK